jgi:hypothetical protein
VQTVVLDSSGTSTALSYTNPVIAGDLLVVAVRLGNKAASGTVTDNNGNLWQLVDRRADTGSGSGDDLELWYAPNALAAPNSRPTLNVRSSLTATIRVVLAEYSGVLATAPLDQHTTQAGTSAAPAVSSGLTTQPTELVLGYGEVENSTTFTPGAGYVLDATVPASAGKKLALEHIVSSAAGVQTASFNISTQAWAIGIVTFRSAGP